VATFDTNHFVTESTQSIAALIKELPDSVVKLTAELAVGSVDMSGETIRLLMFDVSR
jgi:hypothetical protein